jgi:uncharacterized protein
MKRLAKVSAILWIVLAAVSIAAEPIASLHATNYVNDFAGVLDGATQARLNDLCRQVDQKAHAQIAVVTVKTLDGQDESSYALALYQKWGIGAKSTNRGVLILLAIQDRKRFIQVGYGLESILPDGKVGGFGRDAVPILRSGNYAGAVTLMTARVASVIAQDAAVTLDDLPHAAEPRRRPVPRGGLGPVIFIAFVLFFIVTSILRAIFGGRPGRGGPRGGGGSGFLSGLLWAMLFSNMGGRRGGFGGGGFGGFGGGGGGFGGGGFGGFGGGSTGGGGAGGSW